MTLQNEEKETKFMTPVAAYFSHFPPADQVVFTEEHLHVLSGYLPERSVKFIIS